MKTKATSATATSNSENEVNLHEKYRAKIIRNYELNQV